MNLEPTDEQRALREAVRGAIQRDASLAKVRSWVLEGEVDHTAALELAAGQGWTGIGIPEEAGGQGGGLLEVAILAEELGRGAVPADGLYASLLAAQELFMAGREPEMVAALAEGELTGALLAAGDAPLDNADGSGGLHLVLGAPQAGVFIDGGPGTVARGRTKVTPRLLIDRTRSVGDVMIDSSSRRPLPASSLVASWAAVLLAADALGACQRMLDLTVSYVSERVQFGVPVGSFQAVQHCASSMLVAIEGLRAVVQYAAWSVGAGEADAQLDAWVAKARSARVGGDVADGALFLHGAVGYTWEHDLQLLFKRAKSGGELLGGAGTYEDRVADGLALAAPGSR
jgi:alkylation response protein AidB-like acyl-CoA dehydrogenase